MTPTALAAPPRSGLPDLYERLVSAREDLVASLRPGVTGDEVYTRAARFRTSVELELRTAHVGHGIGLEYQEPPRLRPGSMDQVAAGNHSVASTTAGPLRRRARQLPRTSVTTRMKFSPISFFVSASE